MILNDRALEQNLETFVSHKDASLVNPASIDIRVGKTALIESADPQKKWSELILPDGYTYWLPPNGSALIATEEVITIPNGLVGAIFLKSSRAREGYNHALAGWIDPGWEGIITLEVMNTLRTRPLPIYRGLKIAQLVVMEMVAPADRPYSGKYMGSNSVASSYHETR